MLLLYKGGGMEGPRLKDIFRCEKQFVTEGADRRASIIGGKLTNVVYRGTQLMQRPPAFLRFREPSAPAGPGWGRVWVLIGRGGP